MHGRGFTPTPIEEDVETFHHRHFGGTGRTLWLPTLEPTPTLVLGSSQTDDDLDHSRLEHEGIAVVRRRSGGGAVLVSADDLVWFDVVIDDDDRLWSADVGRSFDWLGEAVHDALFHLGVDTERHTARLIRSAWSDRVCFAGLGPGELTVDGRKLVGMSQRRSRSSARMQVAILRKWDAHRHKSFFHDSTSDLSELERAAIGIDAVAGRAIDPNEIVEAVTESLGQR